MRTKDDAATAIVRRAPGALACVAGALLAIRLLATAGRFAARARVVRSLARIGFLRDHRLVHHRPVGLDAEDPIVEVDAAQHRPAQVDNVGLHAQ